VNKRVKVSLRISFKLVNSLLCLLQFLTNAISIILLMWFSGWTQPRLSRTHSQKMTKNCDRVVDFRLVILGRCWCSLIIRQLLRTHLRTIEKNWFLRLLEDRSLKMAVILAHWLPSWCCKSTSWLWVANVHSVELGSTSGCRRLWLVSSLFGSLFDFAFGDFEVCLNYQICPILPVRGTWTRFWTLFGDLGEFLFRALFLTKLLLLCSFIAFIESKI